MPTSGSGAASAAGQGCTPAISAVILAAGESKRLGRPKQLVALGETTVLERTVANFLGSGVGEVIVVLGHRAGEIAGRIAGSPVTVAINPAYRQGMSTSIIAGMKLIGDEAPGIMLALADQPFIDSQTINQLLSAFNTGDKGIVIPVYQGRRGHPVIFAARYRDELLRLEGDIGGREIIRCHPDDVLEVAVGCEGVLVDIDTGDMLPSTGLNTDRERQGE